MSDWFIIIKVDDSNLRGKGVESKQFTINANCPNVDEFSKRFPQYGPYAREEGKFIFEILTNVENFYKMKIVTDLENRLLTQICA